MKTFILITSLVLSLSSSAKVLVCEAKLIGHEALVPEAQQSYRFPLDQKSNLTIIDQSIASEWHTFTFGASVKDGKIAHLWSFNVDGRVSAYDEKKNDHIHSSDGMTLELNCRIE